MTRSPAAKRNLHALWLCAAALTIQSVKPNYPHLQIYNLKIHKQMTNK